MKGGSINRFRVVYSPLTLSKCHRHFFICLDAGGVVFYHRTAKPDGLLYGVIESLTSSRRFMESPELRIVT